LQQTTGTVPVVFVTVVDPVSSGFVDSLARPGGNITGFALYEYSISGKWLESRKLLKRGCMARVPLQPSAQDEEEPRIFPWGRA
jgi:hypothetical protein